MRPTERDIQQATGGVSEAIKKVNGKLNASKTHFLTIIPTKDGSETGKKKITLEGKEIKPATKNEYVKLIGGNVNILAKTVQDVQEVKKFTAKFFPKLRAHPPSIPLLRVVLDGGITMRWVYRKIVDWPQVFRRDEQGETAKVTAAIAKLARSACGLPAKTPWEWLSRGRQKRRG